MPATPKFKTGDIVVLKSGSPDMTVVGYKSTSTPWDNLAEKKAPKPSDPFIYECKWFSGKKCNTEMFSESSLKISSTIVL